MSSVLQEFENNFVDDYQQLYGMLVVLGTNGVLPGGNKNKKKSCYKLYKRKQANGVRPASVHSHQEIMSGDKLTDYDRYNNRNLHSISYTMKKKTIIVPYERDDNTDMFQLGRSSEQQIDFVVVDITPGSSIPTNINNIVPQQSTISRFACRILCDRNPPYHCRIYAAGFDSRMNISLGEKAPKWNEEYRPDGLTTNGVLIRNHDDDNWKEVSVGGRIFDLRDSRSSQSPGKRLEYSDNILTDGTLIDLCGTTLLWRSGQNIKDMPNLVDIDKLIMNLNNTDPQCPVGLSTLAFPLSRRHQNNQLMSLEHSEEKRQPWVYLKCGHVHGRIEWGRMNNNSNEKNTDKNMCPLCRSVGKYVPLWMGEEAGFFKDCQPPTHCFNPCGHVCSEATAKYWSSTYLPHGTQAYNCMCPFCATKLDNRLPYVKLIWQILKD